jgi:hypothetical protein
MTSPKPVFDEAAFHAAQRRRLCNPRHMHEFTGAWAQAFVAQVASQPLLPALALPVDKYSVVDCFAQTSIDQVWRLFHCILKACEVARELDELSLAWATELTVYAAIRCIDMDLLASQPNWRGSGSAANASVTSVPTSSALVAAIGLAGLHGRLLRVGKNGSAKNLVDVSKSLTSTDVQGSILRQMYDAMMGQEMPRRDNHDTPLTPAEVGRLRHKFDTHRFDNELAAVYLVVENLDPDTSMAVITSIADLLNIDVIQGSAGYHTDLTVASSQVTARTLKEKVESIFERLAFFLKFETSDPMSSTTQAQTTEEPSYKWDVFVSHASEDKASFVNDLVRELERTGKRVWYDMGVLKVGDNLVRAISQGLRESRFCIVVLSPRFFAKGWADAEMSSALDHEFSTGRTRVLPIWLDVDATVVKRDAPLLAAKLAINASQGMPAVVSSLLAVIGDTTSTKN